MRNTTCMGFYNLGVDYKYRWGRLVWIGEGLFVKQGYALLNQLKYKILTGYQLAVNTSLIIPMITGLFRAFVRRRSGSANGKRLVSGCGSCSLGALEVFFFGYVSFPGEISHQQGFAGIDGMFQATYSPQKDLCYISITGISAKERDVGKQAGK